MEGQVKQQQHQLENLRKLVKEKDEQIYDLENKVEGQEQSLHDAERKVTAAESKLVRLQATNTELQAELAKAKQSEKSSLMKIQQLQKQSTSGGGGGHAKLNTSSVANLNATTGSATDTASHHQHQFKSHTSSVSGSTEGSLSPQRQSSFATMAGVNPSNLSQLVSTGPSVTSGVDTLWAQSAKIVLSSYDTRVKVLMEESASRATVLTLHQAVLQETNQALKERADALSRSSMTVAKLAQCDEERRMDQFKELTSLREGMLMLEREKTVLSREVTAMDATVGELEEELRHLGRDKLDLVAAHEEILIKYSAAKREVEATASREDSNLTREGILHHSELRGENVRLQDELASSQIEVLALKQRVVNLKKEFGESKKQMSLIIDDSIASREALLSEIREEKLLASSLPTGGRVGENRRNPGISRSSASPERRSGRGDVADTMAKLQRRVQDLEKTVEVKDAQVQNLSFQQRRKKQQQLYVDASVSMKDPYSKGLVRMQSSSSTTQQNNKDLLARALGQSGGGMSHVDSDRRSNNKALSQRDLGQGATLRAPSQDHHGDRLYAPPLKHKAFHV